MNMRTGLSSVLVLLPLFLLPVTLGQPNADHVVNLTSLAGRPWSVFVDPSSRDMYVADNFNHRVLRFSHSDSYTTPVGVLGRPNFTSNPVPGPPTNMTFHDPVEIFLDSSKNLW